MDTRNAVGSVILPLLLLLVLLLLHNNIMAFQQDVGVLIWTLARAHVVVLNKSFIISRRIIFLWLFSCDVKISLGK